MQELVPTSDVTQPVGVKISADANISTAAASFDAEQEEENESEDLNQAVTITPATTASTAVVHRVVVWGGLCGEIAVATQDPYMYSVVARG